MLKFSYAAWFFPAILLTFVVSTAPTMAQDEKTQVAKNLEKPATSSEAGKPQDLTVSTKNTVSTANTASIGSTLNLVPVGSQTIQPQPLSLNDAIRRALENNNDIEIARTDVRIQETSLRSLLGVYDPVLSFTPTYTRNQTTGSNGTNDFRVNSNFINNIKRGGGNYQAFFNNNRTENSFAQAQLSSGTTSIGSSSNRALYSSSLGIQYTQPLLRDFGIDNNRRQIKIQRKRLQQSDVDFRRQTIDIIAQVQRGYWDLVFALRDQQNRTANLNLSKENLRQVEARITAGSAAQLERAEVATELANRETDLLLAVQQVGIAENNLKQLMLRDPNAPEWKNSLVPTDQPVFSLDAINLDDAVRDAMSGRPELSRLKLQSDINDIDIKFFKNQTKPQIDLVTNFSLAGLAQAANTTSTGTVTIPQFSGNEEILRQNLNILLANANLATILNPTTDVPTQSSFLFGSYSRALGNIFRSDAPNYSVGVSISFPFRNRTAEANLAGAKIQQEQVAAQTRSQEQIVITEVRNAVQAVETARQRVLTSRRARENAQIQLDGERKLYDVGRSTTFLLFQRENTLANARNSEIRAETDYNKALADLQRATSSTFRVNNIDIESPVVPDNK